MIVDHKVRAGALATVVLAGIAAAIFAAAPAAGRRTHARVSQLQGRGRRSEAAVYALANKCYAFKSASNGRFVTTAASGYAATASRTHGADAFYLKPTALGTYMLYDRQAKLMSVAGTTLHGVAATGPKTVFAPSGSPDGGFELRSSEDGRLVTVAAGGRLGLTRAAGIETEFRLVALSGCRPFPEAQVDATIHRPGTRMKHGRIFGFIDDHVHVTGNMRSGGDIISGAPYSPFGIPTALGEDAKIHGPDGKLDLIGNLLRTGSPTGTHDTHGWPSFKGWPTYNSMTHQQAYYVWIERAWRAGMRMMVAQTADDQPLCRLAPRRRTKTCAETPSIVAQIKTLKGLQNYVDAQSGGPGRGWFRLVYTPAQASKAMRAGKLAVIIGIESSDLFGCSELNGRDQCTRADINRGIARYKRLGVRGMFVAHWINNAFSGAALEGGIQGIFINVMNRFQTGSYFQTGPCPGPGQGVTVHVLPQSTLQSLLKFFPAAKSIADSPVPTYPSGLQCNTRGLTPLGRYLIERLMANHMLIEVDHMSEPARDTLLSIAARAHYPLISSHNGTGGEWTPAELRRLYRLGGFAAVTPDIAPTLAQKILTMAKYDKPANGFIGIGLGTDTNGFNALPGPRPDAAQNPLHYPFGSYDGSVTFTREQTGTRTFDLNKDGVAQYGLVADLIADVQQTKAGRRALPLLFNSAQAYLDTWQRAFGHH